MLASDIISRASRILFDNTKVRWPESELLDYISDGQRAIVLLRPDANAKNAVLQLVAGSRQSIPADGIRLLRVVRNMGANGASPGRAIREVSRLALDSERPDWHFANPGATVEHYTFDNMDPKRFYVHPSVAASPGTQVEVIYSAIPAAATAAGQTLDLGDHYLNPVLDWVLYRAYSKDATYAGNMQRAGHHLQSFGNTLQVNMTVEFAATLSQPTPPQVMATPPS